MTPQKSKSRRVAPVIGRPPLPRGEARVVLAAQRVAPLTLAKLSRLAAQHGGIGRAIDAAVERL